MSKLELFTKKMLFWTGCAGLVINYCGFLYLLFRGADTSGLPWYFFLLAPWICIFFGLSDAQQVAVLGWFIKKFKRSAPP